MKFHKIYNSVNIAFFVGVIIFLFTTQNLFAQGNEDPLFSQRLIDKITEIKHSSSQINSAKSGSRCLTMVLYEAKRNWDKLTPEGKAFFSSMLNRPADLENTHEPNAGFFKFWYTNLGNNAVDQTDNNLNNIPDYVENMADIFVEVMEMYQNAGFTLPPSDGAEGGDGKYDIYLSNSGAGDGTYGFVAPEDLVTDNPNSANIEEFDSYTSYMGMRSDYNDFGATDEARNNAIKVTAAHEFFHSVQYGYGTYFNNVETMPGFVMEGCAVWAEDWVYPGIDDNFQYFPGFFQSPDAAFNWNNDSEDSPFDQFHDRWYSTWIYFRYLTEIQTPGEIDPVIINNLYTRTITTNYLEAIDNELTENYNSTFDQTLYDFYIAAAILSQNPTLSPYIFNRADDYRNYLEANGIANINFEQSIALSENEIVYDSETDGNSRLMRMGADFIQINPSSNFQVSVTAKDNTPVDNFTLAVIKTDAVWGPSNLAVNYGSVEGTAQFIDINDVDSYSNFVIMILNLDKETTLNSINYNMTISPYGPTNVELANNSLPREIHLYQNYPNPFNPSTKVRYDLPETMEIKIDVIDIIGRVITTLYDGNKSAGTHEIIFEGDGLSSGTYFLRLHSTQMMKVVKLSLLR